MTAQELLTWLQRQPFVPLCIGMNNGESYIVHHPELALVSSMGSLYIYQAVSDEDRTVKDLPTVCANRNISTLHPLSS